MISGGKINFIWTTRSCLSTRNTTNEPVLYEVLQPITNL